MGESSAVADRGRQLASAAFAKVSVEGDLRAAEEFLWQAVRASPSPTLEGAIATSSVVLVADGDICAAQRLLRTAIGTEARVAATSANAALRTLAYICHNGGRAELWAALRRQVGLEQGRARRPDQADLLVVEALAAAVADPGHIPLAALSLMDAEIARLSQHADPSRVTRIAMAATYVDRLPGCREALRRVARDARAGGRLAEVINADILLAIDAYQAGRWDETLRLAEATAALSQAQGYELQRYTSYLQAAFVLADRGHVEAARLLADQVLGWATPRTAGRLQSSARYAFVRCALAESDFGAAYDHAVRIDPGGDQLRPPWVMLDLVEAALRTGRGAEAAAAAGALRDAGVAAVSPRMNLLVTTAEALVAADADADELFGRAVAIDGTERWPFDLARTRLLYGEWLRRCGGPSRAAEPPRSHLITTARAHLAAARDAFQLLGARTWAERASAELRATGQLRQQGLNEGLTPQELQIAQLAATGLTNKQIGSRLFLSPRTVGAHLYRIFPKLGITSRAALRDALSAQLGTPSRRGDLAWRNG